MFISIIIGCSSVKLSPVDFSWPLEVVLKVDEQGFIKEDRYSMKINVRNLFIEEFGTDKDFTNKNVRVIRNSSGTYFFVSEGFKNVYLFNQQLDEMSLSKRISVSESGLKNPFFNQRDSHIELVDGDLKFNLSNEGIIGDKK